MWQQTSKYKPTKFNFLFGFFMNLCKFYEIVRYVYLIYAIQFTQQISLFLFLPKFQI